MTAPEMLVIALSLPKMQKQIHRAESARWRGEPRSARNDNVCFDLASWNVFRATTFGDSCFVI
jgi:hypothetical protein